MVLPAGIAPASIRLEDECLVYFGHGSGSIGLMDWWIGGWRRKRCERSFAGNSSIHLSIRSGLKWSARQDLHLRSPGPKPSMLAATLRAGVALTAVVRAVESQDINLGKVLR